MDPYLPAVHPTFAAEPLAASLWPEYALPLPTDCHLLNCGSNDHYLITTDDGDYILRVYTHGWRTEEDIAYEAAVLNHLESRGVTVCAPIARRDGTYHCMIPAVEGPRVAVLFAFAHGRTPDMARADEDRLCGRMMALIHQHSDGFTCEYRCFAIDLNHLIDEPVEAMLPFLAHRSSDAAFVQAVAGKLRVGLDARIGDLEWGFCHGDFHGGNCRLGMDGALRIFDFDCGGLGWRAYDLSICRLACGADEAQWEVFCEGYREVRPISDAALAAIPWFICARQIWRIGFFIQTWSRLLGRASLGDGFLDQHLGILRDRMARQLPEVSVE